MHVGTAQTPKARKPDIVINVLDSPEEEVSTAFRFKKSPCTDEYKSPVVFPKRQRSLNASKVSNKDEVVDLVSDEVFKKILFSHI